MLSRWPSSCTRSVRGFLRASCQRICGLQCLQPQGTLRRLQQRMMMRATPKCMKMMYSSVPLAKVKVNPMLSV